MSEPSAPLFQHRSHPAPTPAATRAAILAKPAFGQTFTDHMVSIRYTQGQGWHDAEVAPREPILIDPACAVLHYAQEIFEGLKAYRLPDGGAALFRPEANARRFAESATRMAMPILPEAMFLEAVRELVRVDRDWIPSIAGGSLYLRPFMFASEVFLGVKPSAEYRFLVIASPAGPYFRTDAPAITIWASANYTRAAPGGTGAAKCGGNYAAGLIAQAEAAEHGCDQVVFLDAVERRYVEELGGMNLFFVFGDGIVRTPPLTGTILAGITRTSILQLARDAGLSVEEAPYSIDEWQADARSGRLREVFACGTAAVVTPVGTVKGEGMSFTIGNGGPGALTEQLRDRLVAIQRGEAPDPHGWVERVV